LDEQEVKKVAMIEKYRLALCKVVIADRLALGHGINKPAVLKQTQKKNDIHILNCPNFPAEIVNKFIGLGFHGKTSNPTMEATTSNYSTTLETYANNVIPPYQDIYKRLLSFDEVFDRVQ
jgi:hypothetical protein